MRSHLHARSSACLAYLSVQSRCKVCAHLTSGSNRQSLARSACACGATVRRHTMSYCSSRGVANGPRRSFAWQHWLRDREPNRATWSTRTVACRAARACPSAARREGRRAAQPRHRHSRRGARRRERGRTDRAQLHRQPQVQIPLQRRHERIHGMASGRCRQPTREQCAAVVRPMLKRRRRQARRRLSSLRHPPQSESRTKRHGHDRIARLRCPRRPWSVHPLCLQSQQQRCGRVHRPMAQAARARHNLPCATAPSFFALLVPSWQSRPPVPQPAVERSRPPPLQQSVPVQAAARAL
mmetsp:Transcript_73594/g.146357  ORF Transcript_73594/g.146357 Transcript_73594/m.146357 type:complete len:297 (-) Transcript_73594:8-898(-)